ncbi:sensor histidine kinase [Ammoniphilus sp. CFH 90114]|uniref:ATP-binding protein n=1 Tax=Ammoniphilus sp. CFH 90114 TaxID=2493665 RepID=UPI00100DC9E4|nr:sensor histidine kinase [Ammoniphilus sp. CFH 90114]RXT09042.1 sensor histidine kinase [Ammoniphilus sp. CFH 90114]
MRAKTNTTFSLRFKIGVLVFCLVLLSTGISGTMLIEKVYTAIEKELGQRALSIARTVSQVDEVTNYIGTPVGPQIIQPIADKIRLATNVEYIVVMDMDRVRYSHPIPEMIGTVFEGGDEGPAFAEHAYISRAVGVNGPSIRAFVPLMRGSKQVGVVVVGMVTPTYLKLLEEYRNDLYFSLFVALFIGFIGAFLLAYNIKKQMFNMEPNEIARLLEERIAVFQSIGDGIIAIDTNHRITIANPKACEILGLDYPVVGKKIHDVVPETQLADVVKTGIPQYNQDRMLGQTRIMISVLPIRIKGKIVGAVATFQDKTTVFNLAEELTGVKQFIEALRVQNHEYMNKLHTIAGLIQLGKTEQALTYIFDTTEQQEELAAFLTNQIADYSISGLLLGKVSRARELGIDLHIDRNSSLTAIPKPWDSSVMVAVIGNLLQNAMEALQGQELGKRKIYCYIRNDYEVLNIIVEDNGPGIPDEIRELIYIQGFSTKANKDKNRGIGLALIHQYVINAEGTLDLMSDPSFGTRFEIAVPMNPDREEEMDHGREN